VKHDVGTAVRIKSNQSYFINDWMSVRAMAIIADYKHDDDDDAIRKLICKIQIWNFAIVQQ
jgi:hypothetical protein